MENLEIKNRLKYLIKENSANEKFKGKLLIRVFFTSEIFEDLANSIVNRINWFSRAYKIFLIDVSF